MRFSLAAPRLVAFVFSTRCLVASLPRLALLGLAPGMAWSASSEPARAAPSVPGVDTPNVEPASCSRPNYPPMASRRDEQGVTTLALLVGTDGSLRRAEVLGSSGSASLDAAAVASMSTCRFRPAMVQGQPAERWMLTIYIWEVEGTDGKSELITQLAAAAKQGCADAQYALYMVLKQDKPEPPPAREAALQGLLRRAADGGFCLAKQQLGVVYEVGTAVKRDLEQAREWYRQAVACGNPIAVDRLRDLPTAR